jgi:hypothetical protein
MLKASLANIEEAFTSKDMGENYDLLFYLWAVATASTDHVPLVFLLRGTSQLFLAME